MTLSSADVRRVLNRQFVCGWQNITGKTPYAGKSNTHRPTNPARQVNNCSGHHNIQMFFMTSGGRVIHCLPGYWSTKHFLHEVEFVLKLARLYNAKSLSAAERNEKYLDLHLTHAYTHADDLQRSSELQGFDKLHVKKNTKDFQRREGFVRSGLKTADQVIHERMAARPFVPLEKFDVASYINLGRKQYKYNYGLKKGSKKGRGKKGHSCKCGTGCSCKACSCAAE